jgi:putative copper resistance protein D
VTQQLLDTLAYLSVLFHGAVLAAQAITVGGVAFAIFVARQTVLSSCRRLILWSASTLFVAQLALVVIQTISLMNSAELSLAEVAGAEFFVAGAVTLVAAALIIALTAGWWPRSIPLLAIASLGVIAASVMTTHSAARVEHRLPLAIATTFHLLATATWIGGLPYLISALTRTDDNDAARRLARRFSTLALVSVSVLFVAGSILAIVYVGSPSGGYGTAYGIMVGVKIASLPWIAAAGCKQFPPYQEGSDPELAYPRSRVYDILPRPKSASASLSFWRRPP